MFPPSDAASIWRCLIDCLKEYEEYKFVETQINGLTVHGRYTTEEHSKISHLAHNAITSYDYCRLLGGHYLLFFRGVYAMFAASALIKGEKEKSKEWEEKFLSTNFLFEN